MKKRQEGWSAVEPCAGWLARTVLWGDLDREAGSISSGTLYLIFALFSGLWASVIILIELIKENIRIHILYLLLKSIRVQVISLTPVPVVRYYTVREGDQSMRFKGSMRVLRHDNMPKTTPLTRRYCRIRLNYRSTSCFWKWIAAEYNVSLVLQKMYNLLNNNRSKVKTVYVRPLISNNVEWKDHSLRVDDGGKGMGSPDSERIGDWSMPIKVIWEELIVLNKDHRPNSGEVRSDIFYWVGLALGPKWWDTRDYMVIILFCMRGVMSTAIDSPQHVGQDIEPKPETMSEAERLIGHSVGTKNWGFPKGCKPYSGANSLENWEQKSVRNFVGNGVFVVKRLTNEGRQSTTLCEYSSYRNYSTGTKVRKTKPELNLDIQPSYKQLLDINIWKTAYQRLKSNPGNMTPGVDEDTLDGTSKEWAEKIIEQLKSRKFQFKPSKKVKIPKPNGGVRTLGIPSPRDKIVQQCMKMILESVYEPKFKDSSHGFRPGRSTKTAIFEVRKWNGMKWIIEGDIRKYFDTVNHQILAKLLRKQIKDEGLIDLYWKLVKAGYVNNGKYEESTIGVPQGGVLSPILSNIYLHEFDEFMEEIKERYTTPQNVSKKNLKYQQIYRELKKLSTIKRKDMEPSTWERIKALKQELKKQPSVIRTSETGTRVYYNRYADDWVVGVTGGKKLAEEILEKIRKFLKETLEIDLSEEKTKITHIPKDKASYLGFLVSGRNRKYTESQTYEVKSQGSRRRGGNASIIIEAPIQMLMDRLKAKGFLWDNNEKARAKTNWIYFNVEDIIRRYNWVIEGLLECYKSVENKHELGRIMWILKFSAAHTIARKKRMNPKRVWKTYGDPITVKYRVKEEEKKITLSQPDSLKRDLTFHLESYHNIDPFRATTYSVRSNHIWDQPCICCGSETKVVMHHVKHIKVGKTAGFTQIMKNLNRKQVPVCQPCHQKIHTGKYDGMSLNQIQGLNQSK